MKKLAIICLWLMLFLPALALSKETYTYERMFPVTEQAWYFYQPTGVASDINGYIYVANMQNDCIKKFTSDGQFVTRWGREGNNDGDFIDPFSVAADVNGFVYVADMNNHRIQKFTSDGKFVTKWGGKGTGNGQFDLPHGIATDSMGFVYVADTQNNRIQKFTSDGLFISRLTGFAHPQGIAVAQDGAVYVADTENNLIKKFNRSGGLIKQWGKSGKAEGEFYNPHGISVDKNGFVYVTDKFNNRIQKFTSDGVFQQVWGSNGSKNKEFDTPYGIISDSNGYIYVADKGNNRIQKFSSDGKFIAGWGFGAKQGEFNTPKGIAISKNGFVYVADTFNHRIQQFADDGRFVNQWGKQGSGGGEFNFPYGITTDSNGFMYVSDTFNHRIQKFTSDGTFVNQWGKSGKREGEFSSPYGITSDSSDNIYVADWNNQRIQKFDTDGNFILQWGGNGENDGEFIAPYGIAADTQGFIYVIDAVRCCVQKFSSDGKFVAKWGKKGSGERDFDLPYGMAVESVNDKIFIYVADSGNYRIQKFSSEGQFIAKWGERGDQPGQMSYPAAVAIQSDGKVYVADTDNHRIQVFKKGESEFKQKAIIVAGGGKYAGNNLWDATQLCTNFAYRSLIYQGFAKADIRYFSHDTELDMDNNGKADDIAGIPTRNNLENAITSWADDADTFILYLTDHGKKDKFYLSDSETLSAYDLNLWLNRFQNNNPDKKVILIYDACMSGSFSSALSSKNRIIIASTSPDEDAYFITQGSLSFSNFFWSNIFNGYSVEQSFDFAKQFVSDVTKFQQPIIKHGDNQSISDNATFIGRGTSYTWETPRVEHPLCINSENKISCTATAAGKDGIARVWAVIIPPDYNIGSLQKPILELPSFELMPDKTDENNYSGTYDKYYTQNTGIAIYAKDRNGNASAPSLTYSSGSDISKDKAIIVAGDSSGSDNLRTAIETNMKLADDALRFQRYADENIFYMKTPSADNLRLTLENCASTDTHDVLLYLSGKGGDGLFHINDKESLSASILELWLNNLQEKISGKLIVIYDADYSGSFIPLLKAPEGKERILISGTSDKQTALFLQNGKVSFSYFFWNGIYNGVRVRDAFINASGIIEFLLGSRYSQLDDNGNGIGNEISDGQLALNTVIGQGIRIGTFGGHSKGVISDSFGNPIAGAKFYMDNYVYAISLSDGSFRILDLPPGNYTFTIEALCCETRNINLIINELDNPDKNITLTPLNIPPPPTPLLNVSVSGTTATVSWNTIPDSMYKLLYKSDPYANYTSIDVGNLTSLSVTLPEGTILYVAVQAYNDTVSSSLSNIEYISIPKSYLNIGHIGKDLKLNIPCAQYHGNQYQLTLNYSDSLIWKTDSSSLKQIQNSPAACLAVGNDLKLRLTAEYEGDIYSFVLNYIANPNETLTWKMDTETLKKLSGK